MLSHQYLEVYIKIPYKNETISIVIRNLRNTK
jgi:hypothetical protein